jgi:hypothetical protein
MTLEDAESAALQVTWEDPASHYDLRWYGSPEFIVPLWWIGVTDRRTEELTTTDVIHPTDITVPVDVYRWLVPIVGRGVAGRLVSLAADSMSSGTGKASREAGDPWPTAPVDGTRSLDARSWTLANDAEVALI